MATKLTPDGKLPGWHVNKSAVRGEVKKPAGFEAWFYTGPTLAFGHYPPRKGPGAKKK